MRRLLPSLALVAGVGCKAILGIEDDIEVVCEFGSDCPLGFCTSEHACDDTQWALRFGGKGDDEVRDLAHFDEDREGEEPGITVVVGTFEDEISFGDGHVFESAGGRDGFVLALESDGSTRWARHIEGAGDVVVTALDVDDEGNAYIVGEFETEADFGGVTTRSVLGEREGFVARLDDDGAVQWVTELGGSTSLQVADVAVTSFGISVVGTYRGAFASSNEVVDAERTAGFWVAFDADAGTELFGVPLISTGEVSVCCIDMAQTIMVPILGGAFTGVFTSPVGSITSVGAEPDGFTIRPLLMADGTAVLEYTYTGAPVHALEMEGSRLIAGQSVREGVYQDQLVIGATDYLDLDDDAALLVDDASLRARVAAIARTGAGETYALGRFEGEIRFVGGPSFESEDQALYLAFLNEEFLLPSGRTRAFVGEGRVTAGGVAIDGDGRVIVAGGFEDRFGVETEFGAPVLDSEGGLDIFIAQLRL